MDLLNGIGFPEAIIERFFRPFFGGIFFDQEFGTSSRLFDFIFKCLTLGDNTLPEKGISAIPDQLASKLPQESILLNTKVVGINGVDGDSSDSVSVVLENGNILKTGLGIIIAVDELQADRLLPFLDRPNKGPVRSTVCMYFSSAQAQIPSRAPVLFLNGSGKGIVNNMFFATNMAPSAPPGQALVSVSLIECYDDIPDEDLTERVVLELCEWFGKEKVRSWRHLRTYRVKYAQPNQCPPTNMKKNPRVRKGLYVCGDHRTSVTFDGALVSGRKAAEDLLKDLATTRV